MNYESLSYNPITEKIVDILKTRTQNKDDKFFRLQANFYLTLVPSMLNIKVHSPITGTVPINMYGINLSISGSGKGFSTNVLENEVLKEFIQKFSLETYPRYTESKLKLEAINRQPVLNCTLKEAEEKLEKEFKSYGAYLPFFDLASSPAIKQIRRKVLLGKLGSINSVVDEIGFHFDANREALTTFLELFDKGLTKNKLTKNTADNTRYQEPVGESPANILMFGTPSKLLDGGKTEEQYYEMLEAGYARRCFFNISGKNPELLEFSPEELYAQLSAKNQEVEIKKLSTYLAKLCNTSLIGSVIDVPESVGIELLRYRQDCEKRSLAYGEHEEVYKAELGHRYFKVLKLAAAYAFLEGKLAVGLDHLEQAVKFAEDSGESLRQMLEREKPYERLAKYLGSLNGKEATQVDLVTSLPFYKGSNTAKNEMMNMAIAWGYTNNVLIKKTFRDGIEFFTGESLKETNLEEVIVAYSSDVAYKYQNVVANWDNDIPSLVQQPNLHWTNHYIKEGDEGIGHRQEKLMEEGFNCIVLDVDSGMSLDNVKTLLADYEYIIHTTKRHQVTDESGNSNDRFRVIMPTNYKLDLDADEFKLFMQNVAQWCPFDLDESTFQRSRKWATCENAQVYTNKGQLFDVLPFIPRTSREAEYKKSQVSLQSLTNLERWFATRMTLGERNNTMIKYALMLLDNGFNPTEVQEKLLALNSKLANPLDESEIEITIMTTVNNKYKE